MTINLYTYSGERTRLDKTSGLSLPTTLTGTLREGCSVTDPAVVIEAASFPAYNYAYISEFGRYYFIDRVDNVAEDLWRLTMHVDVLMSYRGVRTPNATGIYALSAYVSRSEFSYLSVPGIVDSGFPVEASTTLTVGTTSVKTGYTAWVPSKGYFLNKIQTAARYIMFFNGVSTYNNGELVSSFPFGSVAFPSNKIDDITHILSTLTWDSIFSEHIFIEDILTYMWFPFPLISGSTSPVDKLKSPGLLTQDITLPSGAGYLPNVTHETTWWDVALTPPGSGSTSFERYAPYTKIMLQFLPFGSFELDPAYIFPSSGSTATVNVKAETDVMTGQSVLYYKRSTSGEWIYLGSGQVGLRVPYSAATYHVGVTSLISTVGSIVGAAATGGSMTPSLVAAGVTALQATTPTTAARPGTYSEIDQQPTIYVYNNAPKVGASSLYGHPDARQVTISSLPAGSYAEIDRVHVEGSVFSTALGSEIEELDNVLRTGIIV